MSIATIVCKQCTKCKEMKLLEEFPKNKKMNDGRHSWCRACHAKQLRELRKKHPEKFNTEKRRKKNRERIRELRRYWKEKAFIVLGGKCVRCEFKDMRALQIDHIKANAKKDKKYFGNYTYYKKIAEMSVEERKKTYQILCANCNWIKRWENKECN